MPYTCNTYTAQNHGTYLILTAPVVSSEVGLTNPEQKGRGAQHSPCCERGSDPATTEESSGTTEASSSLPKSTVISLAGGETA